MRRGRFFFHRGGGACEVDSIIWGGGGNDGMYLLNTRAAPSDALSCVQYEGDPCITPVALFEAGEVAWPGWNIQAFRSLILAC